jgi:hypothetical protein
VSSSPSLASSWTFADTGMSTLSNIMEGESECIYKASTWGCKSTFSLSASWLVSRSCKGAASGVSIVVSVRAPCWKFSCGPGGVPASLLVWLECPSFLDLHFPTCQEKKLQLDENMRQEEGKLQTSYSDQNVD